MALSSKASDVATGALTSIPFSSLIGGPLEAAVKAQALAAKTSWDFISNVGLNTDENGNKEAVNVQFSYISGGKQTKLNVPILTILPIPYIIIDNITIDFKAKISASAETSSNTKSSEEKKESKEKSGNVSASVGWGPFSAKASGKSEFKAGFSSKKDSSATDSSKYSVEYTIDVSVKAGQPEIPAGMATILNILQDSIQAAGILIEFADDTIEIGKDMILTVYGTDGKPYTGSIEVLGYDKKVFEEIKVTKDNANYKFTPKLIESPPASLPESTALTFTLDGMTQTADFKVKNKV